MISYYTSPHYNFDAFDPFCIGSHSYLNNSLFNDVMHQLDRHVYYNQSQKMLEKISKPSVKQVETANGYQIQIAKRFGDFNGYEVRVIRNISGDYLLKIKGNSDQFERLYELDPEMIEIGEIDWKWHRNENVLVLNIPKREHRYEERKRVKNVKKSNCKKSHHKRKTTHDKSLNRKLDRLDAALREEQRQRNSENQREEYSKQQDDQQRLIKDQALFEHEETIELPSAESSSALESDTSSETESIESEPIKAKKKNRLPSIEEVEDEEFVLLRKNMI
mmetsp:Transcript_6794/g.6708  ORF Transcript_6794/g.6708 Transcript_6794/m.6708 type:complete len:277 (+) Transcript_6794:4713-5543(+)